MRNGNKAKQCFVQPFRAPFAGEMRRPIFMNIVGQDESESAPQQLHGENDARVLAWPSRAAIALIEMYQRYISPYTPPTCRFHPTCSCYTREAIARFGLMRGLMLGAWRILRCNPMNRGGDDPVPEKMAPKSSEEKAAARRSR